MIIKNYEFKCDKCHKQMKLKHIVWFVKHHKYCGIDEFKVSFLSYFQVLIFPRLVDFACFHGIILFGEEEKISQPCRMWMC